MRETRLRNLCLVNGFAIETDIEGIMLTAFATGFALQYCRIRDIVGFSKRSEGEAHSGVSQNFILKKYNNLLSFHLELEQKSSTISATRKRDTSFAFACRVVLHEVCGSINEVSQFTGERSETAFNKSFVKITTQK